ncbi:mannosyl-oligosaccharide alpha-1,2-mannosidase [Blastomyces gilchristii SLH14081]|uniref:alpha-1,2-Mannosidase n=1 Tax=Blastomyces gilchristii (strain SLH14081) TaxID=559298 RepID=A0A179URJ5_BLAGS|nr:mannosyl-oligosaccharide alpha-1,2-mannosidase [Blastomyces gilchristii SLH14081]OAT10644.1 mannosyl-oligosaccharide alpha-1,2-mannosidase [Blastomyces gilchristii SLH14081]
MRQISFGVFLTAFALVRFAVSSPVLHKEYIRSQKNADRAQEVKDAFEFAWNGYMEYAFPQDELRPVSNTASNSRNGWGASAVDALSTAIIMDSPDIVKTILAHIAKLDYSKTDTQVSLFETTIRYLGGMLSGYDLLSENDMGQNPDHIDSLLAQSQNLADIMKYAFDTPTGIPSNNLRINNKTMDGRTSSGIAEAGTLILEWMHLSDLTGEPEYGELVAKGESYLLHPKPPATEPFPGLIGSDINTTTGYFVNADVSWGGGADSFYEYLIKMFVYDETRFELYRDRWVLAIESSIEHLKSTISSNHGEYTYLAGFRNGKLDFTSQHLTCFNGGNFLLGGQVLCRQDFIDFGLELVKGCYHSYHSTATGIGPEGFGWDPKKVPDDQRKLFEEEGFYITHSNYNLRPEVIESYYYAYRVTGDPMYQEWVWEAFEAVRKICRTESGFTSIGDVNSPTGGRKLDFQESFLFAEVLKYAYLAFAPEADWQVAGKGKNKWVYTTEAHPLKVLTKA